MANPYAIGGITTSPYPPTAMFGNDPETGGPYVIPPRPEEDQDSLRHYNPKSTREKLKLLKALGYAVGINWDRSAKAAWKNYQAAVEKNVDPEAAAQFWSRNSKHAKGLLEVPLTGQSPKAPKGAYLVGPGGMPKGASRGPTSSPSTGKGPPKKAPKTNTATKNTLDLGGGDASKALAQIVAQARRLMKQRVQPTITQDLIKSITDRTDPRVRAETEANLAYEGTIDELRRQIGASEGSVGGIMAGLDKYYGMLDTENEQALAADTATLNENSQALKDATTAFIAAAGGAANEGTASVAQQGVINEGALRSMGQAQQNFDTNLGQFFAEAGADQKAAIRAELERDRGDLSNQLAQAIRERDLFESRAFTEYDTDDEETALALAQARYGQLKDASDTRWNQMLGLGNLIGMSYTLPQTIQQGNLNTAKGVEDYKNQIILNEQERLRLKQFRGQMQGGEQYPFSQLDPGSRAKLASALQENLFGPMGYLVVPPEQFLSTLRGRLYNTAGYNKTPQTEQFIQSLLTPRLVNWWNKYHPKRRYQS